MKQEQGTHLTRTLVSILNHLSGPQLSPLDVEWAVDLPQGRLILERIASLVGDTEASGPSFSASIDRIALHAEEREIWNKAAEMGFVERNAVFSPKSFATPVNLRSRIRLMEDEDIVLSREVLVLKSRVKQIKLAARKVAETIKTLDASLETERADCRRRLDYLSDLSSHADHVISTVVQSARHAAGELNPKTMKDTTHSTHAYHHMEALDALVDSAQLLTKTVCEQYDKRQTDPRHWSAQELQIEAARLQAAFHPEVKDELQVSHAADEEYIAELNIICDRIEQGENWETILNEMEGETAQLQKKAPTHTPSIKTAIEQAWRTDQAAHLAAETEAVDALINNLSHYVLPPLMLLVASLQRSDEEIRETAALVGALVEELEEIVDDVAEDYVPVPTTMSSREVGSDADVGLTDVERILKGALGKTSGMRPTDAPPLVLLNHEDIVAELAALQCREDESYAAEAVWVKSIIHDVDVLRAALHTGPLHVIYANSPSPLVAPFALGPGAENTVAKSKEAGDALKGHICEMQNMLKCEERDDKRRGRKLDMFVTRFIGSS